MEEMEEMEETKNHIEFGSIPKSKLPKKDWEIYMKERKRINSMFKRVKHIANTNSHPSRNEKQGFFKNPKKKN